MGLDLFLERVKKPENLKKYMTLKEINEISNLQLFDEERIKEITCGTILDNVVPVDVETEIWNIKKIAFLMSERENIPYEGLADKIQCTMFGPSACGFSCSLGERHYIEIPRTELQDYLLTTVEKQYGIILYEVAYQRKGLNDEGWDLMPCDNCEYSDDFDAIKDMVRYGGLSQDFIDNWSDGETVFCPWW